MTSPSDHHQPGPASLAWPAGYVAGSGTAAPPVPPLPLSTGSNRSSLTGVQPSSSSGGKGYAADTAQHTGDLGCVERLGEEAACAPLLPPLGKARSFTFGALSPVGSPAQLPSVMGSSPVSPVTIFGQLTPPSPGRALNHMASPRSVRLTGSVRLVGDCIIPLSPGLPPPPLGLGEVLAGTAAAAAGTAAQQGQGVARQLPFANGPLHQSLEGLEARLIREPSLQHLLHSPHSSPQRRRPPLPEAPRPQPGAGQKRGGAEQPAGRTGSGSGGEGSSGGQRTRVISPRKRSRKSQPARAACDDADFSAFQDGGVSTSSAE